MTSRCEDPSGKERARDYVLGRLSEAGQSAYEDHLAGCHACAEQVLSYERGLERLERVSAETASNGLLPGWLAGFVDVSHPGLAVALATAIVVLVLGYPAFLGLYRLPRVEKRAETLQQRRDQVAADLEALRSETSSEIEELRSAVFRGGVVAVHFLARSTRGGGPAETVRIPAAQPVALIGIEVDPLDVASNGETYRFELRSRGRLVWSSTLTGVQVRGYVDSPQGAVIVAIPSISLPEEDYEMKVLRGDGPEAETIFVKRFAIAR
jgi:hypothetical protein